MMLLSFILLILLLLVFLITIKFIRTWIKFSEVYRLPGPPTTPFLGNLLDLGSSMVETHQNFYEFPKKYGELIRVWFGPFTPTLMVGNPEHIEYFLSSSVHITKSPGYDFIRLFLGNGLITSTGDYWRRHRKMITPTFHFKILEQFLVFTNANVNVLMEKMKENVDKEIDIFPLIKLFALDNILHTAMNYNLNTMNNEGGKYVAAVRTFMEIFIKRFFSVVLRIDAIFRLTSLYVEMNEALKFLKGFTDNIIKTRRQERRQQAKSEMVLTGAEEDDMGIKKRKAFLDLMLDIAEENNLTDKEIREEVDTFVFAGHDTISSTLSFAIYELAKRPEIQQRIYEESVEIMGPDVTTPITYRLMKEIKYLEMVIKEVLRMYTTIPLFQRILDVDVELDGYIKVPAGTQIFITALATHHNPKYYPDPEKFDPDRFSPENSAKRHPYAFIPFSAGPRNCVGQKFALMEMKVCLVNIIRNFNIEAVVPEHQLILGNDAVLKSVNGIRIKLCRRI